MEPSLVVGQIDDDQIAVTASHRRRQPPVRPRECSQIYLWRRQVARHASFVSASGPRHQWLVTSTGPCRLHAHAETSTLWLQTVR